MSVDKLVPQTVPMQKIAETTAMFGEPEAMLQVLVDLSLRMVFMTALITEMFIPLATMFLE